MRCHDPAPLIGALDTLRPSPVAATHSEVEAQDTDWPSGAIDAGRDHRSAELAGASTSAIEDAIASPNAPSQLARTAASLDADPRPRKCTIALER